MCNVHATMWGNKSTSGNKKKNKYKEKVYIYIYVKIYREIDVFKSNVFLFFYF